MGDRIESRRLLNRLEYQAVVDAKRNQAAAVIGDRSETTGKYEASEPDGSKVFGVKIDNSVPDGNAVRSLKGQSGQLYLQGQTADLKPRFGELEEDAIAPKGTPLETIISPLSKGADSFAAIDIGNKEPGGDTNDSLLPSHLGNELGYSRGQIWDSPVATLKATYAYAAIGGYEIVEGLLSPALKFWFKFEFLPAFIFCDLADDPIRDDTFNAFFLHDFFLIGASEAIAVIRIRRERLGSISGYLYGYLAYYIAGNTSTRIAEQEPIASYYIPVPDLAAEYERFAQFIPTTFYHFYKPGEPNPSDLPGYYDSAVHASPVWYNFFPAGVQENNLLLPFIEGFSFPNVQNIVYLIDNDSLAAVVNIATSNRIFFSYVQDDKGFFAGGYPFPFSLRPLETNHFVYQIDYGQPSVVQFKKFKAIAYDPTEFGLTSFDETFFYAGTNPRKLNLFNPKFLLH